MTASPGRIQKFTGVYIFLTFHLKVSCPILNPTKLSAALRITDDNPGANLTPLRNSEGRKQKYFLWMLL